MIVYFGIKRATHTLMNKQQLTSQGIRIGNSCARSEESLPNKVDAYLNQKVGKTCQEYSVLNESLNTR